MDMSDNYRYSLSAIFALVLIVSLTSRSSDKVTSSLGSDTNTSFEYGTFHQSGFGGIYNVAHQDGAQARRLLSQREIKIPMSAVEHAIPSLGKENIENLAGHYWHDEHHSPFSSYLYDRPKEALQKEQEDYEAKMKKVREEWGAWNFKDESSIVRPIANFDNTPYKDMNNNDFPEKSWQKDEKYVRDFIGEAKTLVDRMIEGIYAEYGHPTKKADGTRLTEDEIQERDELFKVHISEEKMNTGFSYINQAGMDALSRKLLHGMMTNDEFYFILGGHSAAAGHGNNFFQQKTMQFHHIMEPVFHKLGMRLISRNLAMGGLGTLHFSMGQAELYGEKDFLMWDSAMTEKDAGDIDMFNKQALINGERVPVLFTQHINNLQTETNGLIWHGDFVSGKDVVPLTTGIEQAVTLPFATRYTRCEESVPELCGDRANPNKYDAYCWIDRSDYKTIVRQSNTFGSQVSWHPGWRIHKLESRKAAMTILQGFMNALKIWEDGINDQGFPLKESYWHIGNIYKSVQGNLKTYINGEGKGSSVCERRLAKKGIERACLFVMHGMGEFTPKNLGSANSISAHMKAPQNAWEKVPGTDEEEAYSGINLLPLSWKIPDGEIDLHAIAIATMYEKPQIDPNWYKKDNANDDDIEDIENSRLLRRDELNPNNNNNKRKMSDGDVVPGRGWGVSTTSGPVTGYCDGSSNSFNCHRSKNNYCLRSGHNDGRNTISGDGLSGWLVIQIPKIKEGLIIAKMEWWHPRNDWYLTKDWTEVNDGHRTLGTVVNWPEDVFIDIAINGKIVDTWDAEKLEPMKTELTYNQNLFKFFDDENFIKSKDGEPVELGLRIRSDSDPKLAGLSVTHIYYA